MSQRTYATEQLRSCFGSELLEDERLTEIIVNADGAVWIERAGDAYMSETDIEISEADLTRLAHDLAGNSPISSSTPLAGSEFQFDGSLWRSQVVAPKVIEGGHCLALRRTVVDVLPMKTLCSDVSLNDLQNGKDTLSAPVFAALDGDDLEAFLHAAVKAKWNILFSGGTSSGKTTWLRACLEAIDPNERLVTIEDVYEMRPKQKNCVSMRVSSAATSSDLLKACLRLRPDRIMMGELRSAEAFDFLSVINSGHPGAISTLHADSPDGALWRLSNMVMQAGTAKNQDNIFDECKRAIDVIIQLAKIDGVRRPTDIKVFRERPN